jgi:hypothetical protein
MEVFVLAIILIAIVLLSKKIKDSNEEFIGKYELQDKFYSEAERSFLGVLDSILNEDWRVFGKVRVADVLTPEKGLSKVSDQNRTSFPLTLTL